MASVRDAAIDGLGITTLPDHVRREAVDAGQLVRVLPAWRGLQGIVHLIFTTYEGSHPPLGRKSITWLTARRDVSSRR
nr:hypothetical protein [Novosphingobium sp. B-7]